MTVKKVAEPGQTVRITSRVEYEVISESSVANLLDNIKWALMNSEECLYLPDIFGEEMFDGMYDDAHIEVEVY